MQGEAWNWQPHTFSISWVSCAASHHKWHGNGHRRSLPPTWMLLPPIAAMDSSHSGPCNETTSLQNFRSQSFCGDMTCIRFWGCGFHISVAVAVARLDSDNGRRLTAPPGSPNTFERQRVTTGYRRPSYPIPTFRLHGSSQQISPKSGSDLKSANDQFQTNPNKLWYIIPFIL